MPQVKVWNDNVHPHKETFKGDLIVIPAKEFVYMDESDAHDFRGQYYPMVKNADGQQVPESYKMIRVESSVGPSAVKILCNICRYSASNDADLTKHTKENHASAAIVTDEELDKSLLKKKGA